ncbi:MAG: flagellar biosynthesis protein FlhF [Caldimonas sp.]
MNVKRFTARTSREALRLVRDALGEDAVVLSTRPSAGGVEVLALATESIGQLEAMSEFESTSPTTRAADAELRPRAEIMPKAAAELAATTADEDAERLSMSTLSFQDYVRKRMLKRRHATLHGTSAVSAAAAPSSVVPPTAAVPISVAASTGHRLDVRLDDDMIFPAEMPAPRREPTPAPVFEPVPPRASAPSLAEPAFEAAGALRREGELLAELRAVKGLIEERFGVLAFMEKLQRRPAEARLSQKLLDCGFSPILVRKMADGFKAEAGDETEWASQILEQNLLAAGADHAIEDRGGVFALVGPTGVGKTTTTAKIAAAFAARHGAANLGLITLDAYRVGAHEQLRAYGRILGVPVHTAHDRASLEDLLELLTAKKMVLIDTAGMAQRDTRTKELLDMLAHRSIQRLLVINSASQGETIEDVLIGYRASSCAGIVLSKLDEAVKLAPALDAAIRHRLTVVGVANGQRVPEDWHRLSAHALVQRALRGGGSAAWRLDAAEMNLIFTAPHAVPAGVAVTA